MHYFLNLFSPETWANFRLSGAEISGFSKNQETQARNRLNEGDVLLCYMVKLGRWCGALEVLSTPTIDSTPLFKDEDDPFVVRFKVKPLVVLEPKNAIPVGLPELWSQLSWTKNIEHGSVGWGANFQRSLREIPNEDAILLLKALERQSNDLLEFELSSKDERALHSVTKVRTVRGEVSVEIPDQDDGDQAVSHFEPRDSHRVQAMLAELGAKMGFRIWIPKSDRDRVFQACSYNYQDNLLDQLPMNYNEATVRTIEQIDVIWLKGRSIARAFEVEHTTAIYSGLLRMADLIALQPDINIPLHIVAPENRQSAVLAQLRRPVFSLFDSGPLSERCTLLLYSGVEQILATPHIQHMSDSVLNDFAISADC